MINYAKKSLILALLAGIGFGATAVQAQERVYVIDQRDVVAMSGFGLCWRTGYWTPAAAAKDPAGCQCDKDLLPKEVCEPPAPAPVAAPKPTGEKITVAADALFDFDKAVLRPEGKAKLDELVAKAGAIKLEVILVVGHTDRIGSAAYNHEAVRASRCRREDLPGLQGYRSQPCLHRRQGSDAAGHRRQVQEHQGPARR